jgi:hypothetical protein
VSSTAADEKTKQSREKPRERTQKLLSQPHRALSLQPRR